METKEEEECEKCEAAELSQDSFHATSLKDKGKIFKCTYTGKFEMWYVVINCLILILSHVNIVNIVWSLFWFRIQSG
jgi:hypothetical protein